MECFLINAMSFEGDDSGEEDCFRDCTCEGWGYAMGGCTSANKGTSMLVCNGQDVVSRNGNKWTASPSPSSLLWLLLWLWWCWRFQGLFRHQ